MALAPWAKAPWAVGRGPWAMGHGPWAMADDHGIGNGLGPMGRGPWAMGHGAMGHWRWPMGHGPWAMGRGPLAMGHCESRALCAQGGVTALTVYMREKKNLISIKFFF